jgi:hypothetical protein
MPASRRRRVYLVQKVDWRPYYEESPFHVCLDPTEGQPIKAFWDYDKAVAFCRSLEQEARARENPFQYGRSLEERSRFDPPRLHDWLLDADLTPPGPDAEDEDEEVWLRWWEENEPSMTEAQRARVWAALDQVRFYAVVEL